MFQKCNTAYVVVRSPSQKDIEFIKAKYFKGEFRSSMSFVGVKTFENELQAGSYNYVSIYGNDAFVISTYLGYGWTDYQKKVMVGMEEIALSIEGELGLKCHLCIE